MAAKGIHFGAYVRSLRVAMGWTIRELSEKSGITQPTLIGYEKMERPDKIYASTFGKLAKAFGKTPDGFAEGWSTTEVLLPSLKIDSPSQPAGIRAIERRASTAPLYRSAPASRPDFRELIEDGTIDVPPGRPGRFAAVVEGDCMNPPYPNGAKVLFEPREGTEAIVNEGSFLVVLKTGEVSFKQLLIDPHDRDHVTLRCRNPDRERYPDRRIKRSEIQAVARATSMWVDPEAA